jgi:hypothetical protein
MTSGITTTFESQPEDGIKSEVKLDLPSPTEVSLKKVEESSTDEDSSLVSKSEGTTNIV